MSITVTVNNQKFTFDKGATYHDIYEKVKEKAISLGFDGFMQERRSASKIYTPNFEE